MTHISSRKKSVQLMLSDDLVQEAERLSGDLAMTIELLLAEFVENEARKRAEREPLIDATIAWANALHEECGVIGEEYSPL